MIYRRFCQNSSKETLLQLHVSLIRPCLEYGVCHTCMGSQPSNTYSSCGESTRICDEDVFNWSGSYDELLRDSKLPTLKDRRLLLKLSYLFQVINRSFSFPNAPLTLRHTRSLRNSESQLLLERPFARTNAYMYSYFPHAISLWNNLPLSLHNCTSLLSFKQNLHIHLMS